MTTIKYKNKAEAIAAFKQSLEKKRAWIKKAQEEFESRKIAKATSI